jgi:ADP-heptose:LPS heptosyltransferase/GT2 family glycosyltransferase
MNFADIVQEISGVTIVDSQLWEPLYRVCERVSHLPHSVAECGVYRGGSLRLIARALPDKTVWGFDTFAGMPAEMVRDFDTHSAGDFGDSSYDQVAAFLRDLNNVRLVQGVFPESFARVPPDEKFCLVHLDCDQYDSYHAALDFFLPRLVEGGFIVIDDYTHCEGARRAIDERFPGVGKPPYAIRKNGDFETEIFHKDINYYRNYCKVLNTEIQEKAREIAKLKRTLRETQRSIASLYASHSWRVTWPLRQVDNFFRKLRKSPAVFRDLFAWRELRTTGWHGLILRLKKLIEKREDEWHYPRSNDYTKGMVTIAILTKNRLDLIKPCIESIEKNLSEKYQGEILIGDRGSTDRDVISFYNDAIEEYGNIEVVDYSRYSSFNNLNHLIKIYANGQFLILLRNDMIVNSNWIDQLIDPLEDKHIGLVGGKIICLDNTIQHAGAEFNKNGLGVEIYKNRPKDYPEANYKAYVPAVTLACAAMRHDVFDRFQLNENFKGEAQDSDFCLRLAEAGFRVLYNPEAEIYHVDGASLGWRQGYRERRLLHQKWGKRIQELAVQGNQRAEFDENEYKSSITIIRDDGIGDLLMGVSAFKKLRRRYPEKKLILLTYQRNIEMMSGFKIFDEFLPIPNREKYAPLPIPKDSQTYNFIDLEMIFGNIWGRPKEDNKVHRHLIYSRDLGLDNSFELVPMPEYSEAKQKVVKLFRELNIDLNQKFVVLNLIATNPARSWWEPYYFKLIESIEGFGFIPLVVGTEDSKFYKGNKLINLTNKTRTITEYIEVVKLGKYVISTDTSAYHIAALSGIPFLAIFTGGIEPESRVMFYTKYEVVKPPADLKCHPCWDQGCSDLSIRWKSDPCRTSITPEVVIERFKKLVENTLMISE